MQDIGYIYVMINPSMPGIVKVGKTTREQEERRKELSSATGVPSEFILVYKEMFENCSAAEAYIHQLLQENGFRVSGNREFFSAPIDKVIKIIQEHNQNLDSIEPINNKNKNFTFNIAIDYYKEAIKYYFGGENYLEDINEALKLFKKAAKLEMIEAYLNIGKIYLYDMNNKKNEALEWFKKGANKGNNYCFAEMAMIYSIYSNKNDDIFNIENASKCWREYLNHVIINRVTKEDFRYFRRCIEFIRTNRIELNCKEILALYGEDIISTMKDTLKFYLDTEDLEYREYHIENLYEDIKYLETQLIGIEKIENINLNFLIQDVCTLDSDTYKDTTLLVGKIAKGKIKREDKIKVVNRYGEKVSDVLAIEKDRKLVQFASEGDSIGLLINGNIDEYKFVINENTWVTK